MNKFSFFDFKGLLSLGRKIPRPNHKSEKGKSRRKNKRIKQNLVQCIQEKGEETIWERCVIVHKRLSI